MNPNIIWHSLDKKRVTAQEFITVIEIPRGCKKKYEIDKETGMIILDRILRTATHYPCSYGFIPRTLSEDGDPLDVMVICTETLDPNTLVKCRPVGVIEMIDNGERDEKIINYAACLLGGGRLFRRAAGSSARKRHYY
jgi:inorganic pyrophosphatase